MNRWMSLMQREWMQHRFGWTVVALGPMLVMLMLASVGKIDLSDAEVSNDADLPTVLAMAVFGASMALTLAAVWLTSLILVAGLARRDHSDRSVEFWLSMPVGHVPSVTAPLAVHLLLVPMAALAVGLLASIPVSLVFLARTVGIEAWFSLPWLQIMLGGAAMAARLALGIALATLWLLPLILLVILMTAWLKRWGLVVLVAGVGLGSAVMDKVLGYPWLSDVIYGLLVRANRSFISVDTSEPEIKDLDGVVTALPMIPSWAAADAGLALGQMVSPSLLLVVAASALLLAGLVDWRRRGASAAS